MSEETTGPPVFAGPPPQDAVRRPTNLLKDFIEASESFRSALQGQLSVNRTDLTVMEHLMADGPLGPSEISRRLGISTSSTTTAVDRLVALGHVSRESHPSDRRGVRVAAAPASVARAFALLMPALLETDAVLDDFDETERAAIAAYLERVVEVFRSHAARHAADG